MANRHTSGKASAKTGELTFQHQETDSPIIPVAQMERLHVFKPEAVDWIINQTQIEAESRRFESKRVNTFIFIEHILGQVFALAIGAGGIYAGAHLALAGQPWDGGTIATAAITGLAVVFLTGRQKRK